jgi:glucose/arabinose dehydrogenase
MLRKLAGPVAAAVLIAGAVTASTLGGDEPATSAPGFTDEVVLSGLKEPLGVAFARDGRVFIAEKRGRVLEFAGLTSRRPRVFADLGRRVFWNGDRGLFGLALDPAFPGRPYVYVLYTFDGPIGASRPLGRGACEGLLEGKCPVSGRLSRLERGGAERVLLSGWCQQYPSHGVGDLLVGPDGLLYASGGEGASYDRVDTGDARNVCGDPPREGGALRAQDAGTDDDSLGVSGAVVRVDPTSGRRELVAYGLRNPFRLAFRPDSRDLWLGDVGSTRSDELDVVEGEIPNFGWPCYEGERALRSFDEANVPICERLYQARSTTPPVAELARDEPIVDGDGCGRGTQALSGLAFYRGGSYPEGYRGALFFADFVRRCIWTIPAGEDGRPEPGRIELFRSGVASPVRLLTGPGGNLFYLDFFGGSLHRIRYTGED